MFQKFFKCMFVIAFKFRFINNVQLEELQSIQDLGVTFDSQLKFDKHVIDDKINKAHSFLGIIKRNLPISIKMHL